MTISEVRAILEKNYEKHYFNVTIYNDYNIDKAYNYIQEQTGCDLDIAQKIVHEMKYKQYQKEQSTVKCPYCNSSDVTKITNVSKAKHTFLFGFYAMSRNAKNFHCNNCNSNF